MQPIHPITQKTCQGLYGKPVLIYLNDGSEIYGVLSRIEKNTLILNDDTLPKLNTSSKKTKKTVSNTKSVKTKTSKSQAQPPLQDQALEEYSYFGLPLFGGPTPGYTRGFDIPLGSIAAMFSE
ncbi:hypothetical protein SAMN04487897_12355 [Paenibacillus sp. yr247]|uniref:hypothetical protein n=1 Tax=Paenibacillus sp. yr247 TaxID=1761880 RepID=UPI00087E7D7C|nr:hypothetical protein [Paenibacillus sp. yr247]SDO81913.1 hypothetical protein SAMN04487897_12355 [Paenibacillus sp. yr247]